MVILSQVRVQLMLRRSLRLRVHRDLPVAYISVSRLMENTSCLLVRIQENNDLYGAGSMPGFCIVLEQAAILSGCKNGISDTQKRSGRRKQSPPRYLVQQMDA
ncbi:hypothetical protein PALA111701_19425 [Paenibacillus lactis]|uniref:hypothetical protein n=1 Tax=Paenibacillus sp. DYY-L-2 TaxID=3447013 RepID=UPI0039F35A35